MDEMQTYFERAAEMTSKSDDPRKMLLGVMQSQLSVDDLSCRAIARGVGKAQFLGRSWGALAYRHFCVIELENLYQ